MFRVKPYTKCLQCIRTDRLKCKECMEKLISRAAKDKQTSSLSDILRKSPKYKHLYDSKYPFISKNKNRCANRHSPTSHSNYNSPKAKGKPSSSSPSYSVSILNKLPSRNGHMVKTTQSPSASAKYEIESNYTAWMKSLDEKRLLQQQNGYDMLRRTLEQWPVKKRTLASQDVGIDNNGGKMKFENWQRRFVERMKTVQQKHRTSNRFRVSKKAYHNTQHQNHQQRSAVTTAGESHFSINNNSSNFSSFRG